jgi:MarR family transcriptional regulator, organic hydroperoxide resistance regulator
MREKRGEDERFPPLSTSIESLLRDGSDSDFRNLVYSLIRLGEMIVHHRDIYGAYIGVTGPQYQMMAILAVAPNSTAGEIAKTMSVSNQFVVSETGKLVARKILQKTTNQADRRSMLLNLTHKGRDLLRELGPLRRQSNDLMYRSLTGNRAGVLQKIVDALIADAEIALHELAGPHRRGQKAPTASSDDGGRKGASHSMRTLVKGRSQRASAR